MGNKLGSRRKSSSDSKKEVKRRPKKKTSDSSQSNRDKKVISCPDLSGAVPYRFDEDDSKVDVKVYRSYSSVAEADKQPCGGLISSDLAPDIKVYRRSSGRRQLQAGPPDKSQTLPRSFGRSRSATSNLQHSNGTLPTGEKKQDGVQRRSTMGYSSFSETRGSKRTLSTASMSSIGYKVHAEDFPETAVIKRKLHHFEAVFVRSLTEVFTGLPENVQLSLLSIAIRPHRANQQVSLWQYLNTADVPINLHELTNDDQQDYVLTIPTALFEDVYRIRHEKMTNMIELTAVAKQILTCLATEAANELSRIYEYQLALMPDGLPMELLARHGTQCIYEYLKKKSKYLDRNTIVHGVVKGQLRAPEVCPKFSIILGERELKWNLYEVFKKPGLRKEMFLFSCDIEVDADQAPWKFCTSLKSDPMLYGYRGLLVDWDFATSTYTMNGEDEVSFQEELDWRPDDFHREYCPYRRLVGLGVLQNFYRLSASGGQQKETTFGEYVKQIQGRSYSRDRIQPVYRPLGEDRQVSNQFRLDGLNLGNADILRIRNPMQTRKGSGSEKDSLHDNRGVGGSKQTSSGLDKATGDSIGLASPKATATAEHREASQGGLESSSPIKIGKVSVSIATPKHAQVNHLCNNIDYNTGNISPAESNFRHEDVIASTPVDSQKVSQSKIIQNNDKELEINKSPSLCTEIILKDDKNRIMITGESIDGTDVDNEFIQSKRNSTSVSSDVCRTTITSDV